MSPHIIATVTLDDNENCSPDMESPKPKGRILYCRKCEGHGEKVILKNHSPQCPYILCNCKSCEKLNYKRLKSFNKRNKEKIELAAALNAKRHANESSSSIDDDEGFSRRSSFSCSKTSSPDMEQQQQQQQQSSANNQVTTAAQNSDLVSTTTGNNNPGLEGRSMSLGAMTVMSYDIWKAKMAAEQKRKDEERAKNINIDEEIEVVERKSLSPAPIRKRAHTFVAQTVTKRTEDIPAIATKKLSVDEKSKGKYILLPTIPAMRIFVNEEEEVEKPTPEILPSTSRPFQLPKPTILPPPPAAQMQQQITPPQPIITSPFKPVIPTTMSTEQIISSLTLHNTVLQQQQQNNQIMQDLLHNLSSPSSIPSIEVLSMLRLQQQAAALAAALTQVPQIQHQPQHQQMNLTTSPLLPKPIPTTANLLNTFLQTPAALYTNSV